MRDHEPKVFTDLRTIILPTKFQYLTAGLSSTINSSWGGLAVAEYCHRINGSLTFQIHAGLMKPLMWLMDIQLLQQRPPRFSLLLQRQYLE